MSVLNFFNSQQRSLLGIDISSTSVKILEISHSGDRYCVEGYARAALPEGAMDGVLVKDVEMVASTIKNLLSSTHFTSKKAACAVPESSAISKIIQLDASLSTYEMEELVISEADKYIPYPIDEINIDFNVIGPSLKNPAFHDVLIVASRTENISSRIEMMEKSGLTATIVDVESYAIERACQFLKTQLPAAGEKKNVAIIDIGSIYTHIYVLHDMKMIFSREEEFGGKQLIDLMMGQYGMTRTDARKAIESANLPADYDMMVLEPFKEIVLLQTKRALQFFFSTSHHTYIDHIVLAGGVAKLPAIAELLEEHINIPTTIANPFAQMSFGNKVNPDIITSDSPLLMIACGLALRHNG